MKYIQLLILTILHFPVWCQSTIKIDPILEMHVDQFDLQKPLQLWLNFLNTKNDLAGSVFWNENEVKKYGESSYFLLKDLDYINAGDIVKNLKQGTTVIGITENQGLFKITSKLEFKLNDSTSINPFIFHVYAKSQGNDDELKLYNPLDINKELFTNCEKIGNIEYSYLKSHEFDKKKAKLQVKEINKLAEKYDITVSNYKFIFTDNSESMYRLRGYDFHFQSIGIETPSGKADVKNNTVYSFGCDEYYPHELIHLFINPTWPDTHNWLIEGFATYYGGSRGKSLDWHLNALAKHLKQNPDVNLSNMLELRNMNIITGYRYVLGGYIVKLTYEKGGIQLVKKIMQSGKTDLEFYKSIESTLGISRNELNNYLRQDLESKYLKHTL